MNRFPVIEPENEIGRGGFIKARTRISLWDCGLATGQNKAEQQPSRESYQRVLQIHSFVRYTPVSIPVIEAAYEITNASGSAGNEGGKQRTENKQRTIYTVRRA
jgi:hypothetical protein